MRRLNLVRNGGEAIDLKLRQRINLFKAVRGKQVGLRFCARLKAYRTSTMSLGEAPDPFHSLFQLGHRSRVRHTYKAWRAEASTIRDYSLFLLKQSLCKISGGLQILLQAPTNIWKSVKGPFGLAAFQSGNVT